MKAVWNSGSLSGFSVAWRVYQHINWSAAMKTHTTILLLLVTTLSQSVVAKDVPMTPGWSGQWSDASGQHRCAIQLENAADPTRLSVLCQLGATSTFANLTPAPAYGELIPLAHNRAGFGASQSDPAPWGDLLWFAVCDRGQPAVFVYAFGSINTVTFWLRPVMVPSRSKLCLSTG